jgi:hypothetical protein
VVKKKDVKVDEVLQVDKVEENVHASTPLQKSSFQSVEVSKKKSERDIHGKSNSDEKEEKEEEVEEEEEDSLNESTLETTNKTKKKSTHCSSSKRIFMIHQSTNTE